MLCNTTHIFSFSPLYCFSAEIAKHIATLHRVGERVRRESEKSCFVYFELLPSTFIYFVTFISPREWSVAVMIMDREVGVEVKTYLVHSIVSAE